MDGFDDHLDNYGDPGPGNAYGPGNNRTPTDTERDHLQRLRFAWLDARIASGADEADPAVDRAWDEWVDYVEAHDLNYTEYDPRNTHSPQWEDPR